MDSVPKGTINKPLIPLDYTLHLICEFLCGRDLHNLSLVNSALCRLCVLYVKQNRIVGAKNNIDKAIFYADRGYKVQLSLMGTNISDVSKLKNIYYLILADTNVTDVSMLGNVYHLDLSQTKVKDVSSLGNVHYLHLAFTDVEDVSMLGNVHTLFIYNTKVTNISGLENVPKLYR